MRELKSTCCYCGVGCGVLIATDGARITGVRGDPDPPANFGRLCTKGATLHLTLEPAARAAYPELRTGRAVERERVSWDRALDHVADRFAAIIREHGPDSVAFYISGQLLTEDYYVLNKLAKGLIGTNNLDTNSRLCMSSAVSGYKRTLGADAPPACYDDIAHADCLFIAGANMAYAHPVLFRRIEAAKSDHPDLKIIVVDPRRTDTAAAADLFLPIKPGTDVALFDGMLSCMIAQCWLNDRYIEHHTQGFAALAAVVRQYSLEKTEPLRSMLLAPPAQAPAGAAAQGRIVCACLDVSETEIDAERAAAAALRRAGPDARHADRQRACGERLCTARAPLATTQRAACVNISARSLLEQTFKGGNHGRDISVAWAHDSSRPGSTGHHHRRGERRLRRRG